MIWSQVCGQTCGPSQIQTRKQNKLMGLESCCRASWLLMCNFWQMNRIIIRNSVGKWLNLTVRLTLITVGMRRFVTFFCQLDQQTSAKPFCWSSLKVLTSGGAFSYIFLTPYGFLVCNICKLYIVDQTGFCLTLSSVLQCSGNWLVNSGSSAGQSERSSREAVCY